MSRYIIRLLERIRKGIKGGLEATRVDRGSWNSRSSRPTVRATDNSTPRRKVVPTVQARYFMSLPYLTT